MHHLNNWWTSLSFNVIYHDYIKNINWTGPYFIFTAIWFPYVFIGIWGTKTHPTLIPFFTSRIWGLALQTPSCLLVPSLWLLASRSLKTTRSMQSHSRCTHNQMYVTYSEDIISLLSMSWLRICLVEPTITRHCVQPPTELRLDSQPSYSHTTGGQRGLSRSTHW